MTRTYFRGESYRNTTWVSRKKKPQFWWGQAEWIAVFRLFRDLDWDKMGASSGGELLETDGIWA